jgi:hypothetical protein
MKPLNTTPSPLSDNSLRADPTPITGRVQGAIDPGLQRVVEAWPALPEHIRQAMLALVRTTR